MQRLVDHKRACNGLRQCRPNRRFTPKAQCSRNTAALCRRDVVAAFTIGAPALLSASPSTADEIATRQIYLQVSIDGKPAGKLLFETVPGAPVGSQRFVDLCVGKQGVAYRLSKFDYISESYLRVEGVRQLSYAADGVSPIAGGESVAELEEELAASTLKHTEPYLVSLVVKEDKERPVQEKLIAVNGKLVTVTNQSGEAPNGTAFVITKGPVPELDATNLVVARLVGGFATLDRISDVPIFKNNEASPFFQTAKFVGDKRAVVAEKGFNRPLFRVVVTKGGYV